MIKTKVALFMVAFATLMLELTLIKIFDSLWAPHMAYMVITLALFCFALAGIYLSLKPLAAHKDPAFRLSVMAFAFGVFSIVILPVLNYLDFDFDILFSDPKKGVFLILIVYFVLALPFFFSGSVFAILFSKYASNIRTLYFWDLIGAGLGSIAIIPFLPYVGPGGLLFMVGGICIIASGLFAKHIVWRNVALVIGTACIVAPFVSSADYFVFKAHGDKRNIRTLRLLGKIELTHWDPVSKIDVAGFEARKDILYDGGSQTSVVVKFDGNFKKLRKGLPANYRQQFTHPAVIASHYLKRDSQQDVLVIGSAGGQEVKAALTYGAATIDAIELVGYVVELGKKKYASYNGQIYNHPNVNYLKGEGRSFLRSENKRYDIIQIFSNHTSSSIAAGNGAMATTYLQTVEAYIEYFRHLKKDGVLQINHHVYPRMVTTAAAAWRKLGYTSFRQHVLVYQNKTKGFQDNLPTFMVKMSPWTQKEVTEMNSIISKRELVEDPLSGENRYLPDEYFSGRLSPETIEKSPFNIFASTDNRPFFNFLRKSTEKIMPGSGVYMDYSTASLLNSQLSKLGIPREIFHLVITSYASLIFIVLFIVAPLYYSSAGRAHWNSKTTTLIYFSCLGAGFIIIELMFIQMFMKLIGYPLYTYSTVVFALLLAAGLGSLAAQKLGIDVKNKWYWPFIGIATIGIVFLFSYHWIFNTFLQEPIWIRIGISLAMIIPLGIFMGMPLPLGILAIQDQPKGAIPWAWGMNGLFTVIGGVLSVVLTLYIGFKLLFLIALVIYMAAFIAFARLREKGSNSAAVI
ncbi:MAG TPA: hypothetical protein ENI80_02995 [Acidiferrobacteraceae bacterium]|nr:hypothetical protein [Acidiferrobacteraceae bacterium]